MRNKYYWKHRTQLLDSYRGLRIEIDCLTIQIDIIITQLERFHKRKCHLL